MTIEQKNKKILLIFILVFTFSIVGYILFSTVTSHDTNLKKWTRMLAVSCNLFSVKNSRFPTNLDELLEQGSVQVPADRVSDISYSLKNDGNDGTITANLYFDKKYTINCTDEKFSD